MYVGIGGPKGYEQVTIREDVYNPTTSGKKTRIVRKVGKLSDLLAENPDFLVKLKEEVHSLKEVEKPILLPPSVEQIEKPSDATPINVSQGVSGHSEAPEYEGASQKHDSYTVPLSYEARSEQESELNLVGDFIFSIFS
jgi:hypothetical protein